jgi:cytochrome d ubiquinol oxidase subunit II
MLIGIVLRGSAFAFRAYDVKSSDTNRTWGRIFAIASAFTPILLGDCIGAIASGSLVQASPDSTIYATYFAPWLAPFPIACGVLTLATFTFLAAVYLTVDARDDALREDVRRRALWSAGVVFVAAFGTLAIANRTAPQIGVTLMHSSWAAPFHVATGIAAVVAIAALWTRRFRLARVAAAGQVMLILWGWVASQYPAMIPGRLSIADAAAPDITLRLTLYVLAAGGLVLFPSLWYLLRVFKGERPTSS